MQVDTHQERLSALGLNQRNYRALLMLPVVYIAWSNGSLSDDARRRAFEVGKQAFGLDEGTLKVLDDWLSRPLPPNGYRLAFEELRHLVRAVDEPLFDGDMVRLSLSHAEAVARANVKVPIAKGAPWAVNAAEREALRYVATMLGVDLGETWADVVAAVDTAEEPSGKALSGEDQQVDQEALTARFDASRQPDAEPTERDNPAMRHLKSAMRNKKTERELDPPPQIKGGKM